MNKTFTSLLICAACALPSLAADADGDIAILTFEDADYKGNVEQAPFHTDAMTADNYFTSLIDSKQYNGPLLYGDVPYTWLDAANTNLIGGLQEKYEEYLFYNGGTAISNYVTDNYAGVDFTQQLLAYSPDGKNAGCDGSTNFLVCFGNCEPNLWDFRPVISFDGADGEPQYAYINLSAYGIDAAINGNAFSAKPTDTDYVDILAEPLDMDGNPLADAISIRLVDGPDKVVTSWVKWDLSALGKCRSIRFDMRSSIANAYGMTFPTYFLLDNIAVRKSADAGVNDITIGDQAADNAIYTLTGIRVKEASAPGIYIINGKKVYVK